MTKSQKRVYDSVMFLTSSGGAVTMEQVAENLKITGQTHKISGRFTELVRDGHLKIVNKRRGFNTYAVGTPDRRSTLEKLMEQYNPKATNFYNPYS